ncbi:MAG: acyl-CoA dehydrogenase family protein, partial [Burkholderiales bacterium]
MFPLPIVEPACACLGQLPPDRRRHCGPARVGEPMLYPLSWRVKYSKWCFAGSRTWGKLPTGAHPSMNLSSPYFDDTHRLLRDTLRRFVEKEVIPHAPAWEEQGFVPRQV